MSSDNCAVGPDGELLDKSEIPWVYDPDDDRPMPPMTTSLTDQRQLSATTLDSFVTKSLQLHIDLLTHLVRLQK